jgi:hypothetical protein
MYRLISLRPAVLGLVLLASCGASSFRALPGEGSTGRPCDQIIPGCDARRLENLVLRGDATDGAFISIDGLETSGVLSFDEALEMAWRNDYRGGSKTVQVILGASNAWGTGTNLYYGVKWGGVCQMDTGPAGSPSGALDCDGVWGTVLDAQTGGFIVSGM